MSLEDLDKAIADADPTALSNIESVRKIAEEIGQPLEILEADSFSLETDIEKLKKLQGIKAKLRLKSIIFKSTRKVRITLKCCKPGMKKRRLMIISGF